MSLHISAILPVDLEKIILTSKHFVEKKNMLDFNRYKPSVLFMGYRQTCKNRSDATNAASDQVQYLEGSWNHEYFRSLAKLT